MRPEGRLVRLMLTSLLVTLGLFTNGAVGQTPADTYKVGVGIGDVTGPVAEVGMMGYASATQSAKGLHFRLFARAFIFGEQNSEERAVFVSVDCAMVGSAIKHEVINDLSKIFGTTYTAKNVLISATHTHSGPAGYMQYALYGISSYGFLMSNFRAVVDGIVESIVRAHNNIQDGRIYTASGLLDKEDTANINRSPYAYNQNPVDERTKYLSEGGSTDKRMTLLGIEDLDGNPIGLINWFAVHPTSMQNTNSHVSGDNKGYASMQVEYLMNDKGKVRPGQGKFVAAFGSSNLGDVSPNILGPKCQQGAHEGEVCDVPSSTCGGFTQNCWALGPGGKDMVESTRVIGQRQADKAIELLNESANHEHGIHGSIRVAHQYINMSEYKVTLRYPDGTTEDVFTCPGALGYSFAAGTTDGPGAFNFTQGDVTGNSFWDLIRDVLHAPTAQQIACHAPKPILLDVGETHFPYDWVAHIVETQMLKIGNFYIVGVPGELTTMSGRRMREAIQETVNARDDTHVAVAGLSNVYTHYITTFEEYQAQRYEGASTLYGPHTLSAYIQQFKLLTASMLEETVVEDGPPPPILIKGQISLNPPIFMDAVPGECLTQPYKLGFFGEVIQTVFVSGHPRNNPMRSGTFFLVEWTEPTNAGTDQDDWKIVATDADWNTKFTWKRPYPLNPRSEMTIEWDTSQTPFELQEGWYRIRHFGYYKPALKSPLPYDTATETFKMCKRGSPASVFCGGPPPRKESPKKTINSVGDLWRFLLGR